MLSIPEKMTIKVHKTTKRPIRNEKNTFYNLSSYIKNELMKYLNKILNKISEKNLN